MAGLPLVDDLGSGALVAVSDEPTPASSLAAGADLVCFSGDKLLGGPQAGIVAGRADLVERLRRHPLQRALRADKLTLAALEGTLRLALDPERARREIPILALLEESRDDIRSRAERLAERVGGDVEETVARVGGGALPLTELSSFACAVEESLFEPLRLGEPPVVGIVRDGRLLLDVRAVTDAEVDEVADAVVAARAAAATAASGSEPLGGVRGVALTVGTAGHIDHGKTWLVRALTGKDTDRLPEEQRRGISIDLGYAPLLLPDGRRLSLVDVPGHERFVRTMVAGATGIDLFLLVIDAAEGARPQTLEHLAILRLLGVDAGVVAVTKADLVDEETLELALEEARELVPGTEVVAVSAKTGEGLDELRAALARVADTVTVRSADGPARLYVDRVFTLKGIGTVVTGTLWSGSIGEGDTLAVAPRGGEVRVRSVQVHDSAVERATAGERVALSLPGVERRELHRGDALVTPGAFPASYRLDVELEELTPIEGGARVSVHHGTSRIPARVARVGGHAAQLRLEAPVVAARGDRVVLRDATTVGGATVLDPAPPRRLDERRLELLEHGDPASIVAATVDAPVAVEALAARGLLSPPELEEGLTAVVQADGWAFSQRWLDETRASVAERLRVRAQESPLEPGLAVAELLPAEPWAAAVLPLLPVERRGGIAYLPGVAASLGTRSEAAGAVERELEAAGLAAVKVEDAELARYLESEGRLVRLGDGYAASAAGYERARELVVEECRAAGEITLARFRDLAGVGRRDAQLLLERLDQDGVTRRLGDRRVLRRAVR